MELPFSHPTCSQAQQEKKMAWFPRLREFVIFYCPKLVSMPSIPWWTGAPCSAQLERVGTGIEQLVYPSYGIEFSLGIEGKGGEGDEFWSGLNFSNLTDLEKFHMKIIPFLPLDKLRVLTSLKKIRIEGVSSVLPPVEGDWCHGMYRFPVEDLEISRCDATGKELTLLLSFLPNLSQLSISECKNITGLGVVEDAETVSREQQQQTRVGSRGGNNNSSGSARIAILAFPATGLGYLSMLKCELTPQFIARQPQRSRRGPPTSSLSQFIGCMGLPRVPVLFSRVTCCQIVGWQNKTASYCWSAKAHARTNGKSVGKKDTIAQLVGKGSG